MFKLKELINRAAFLLIAINNTNQRYCKSKLARMIKQTPNNINAICRVLEKKNYIIQQPKGRTMICIPTKKGALIAEHLTKIINEF